MEASRRQFLFKAGKIAAVVLGGAYALRTCDAIPDSAAEAWQGPEEALEEDIRLWVLSYAILAPSASNMQPWKVDLRLADDLIRLFIDEGQLLPAADPFARQTLVGLGSFIESLVIAASEQGYRAEVTYFPEGSLVTDHPGRVPVADIRLVADDTVHPDPLFEYLLTRRTNQQLYLPTPLSDAHRKTLNCAMTANGVAMDWISKQQDVDAVRMAAAKAVGVEMTTPATMQESIATTRIGAGSIDDNRDGKALNGIAVWWLQKTGRLSESNASTPGSWGYNTIFLSATSHLAATPGFVLFESSGGSREGHLATGRAYLRFNLLATSLGVAVHPVNHVLAEYEAVRETREAMYHALNKSDFRSVNMVVRVGYALEDVPAPTARRPLEAIVLKDDQVNGEVAEEKES
ncbi:MAG: Acg family FMN-binding oxidoreductase [Thiolinea sp.]